MTELTVSVIVVSQGRPDALKRCLLGLSQLVYCPFEIIVVADAEGLQAIRSFGFFDRIKTQKFERLNISAARNTGLAIASGEIVAFVDDDAVPEPTWLWHLSAPFEQEDVDAATGFVRGRNGISFQWTSSLVNTLCQEAGLPIEGLETVVFRGSPDFAIKTPGTNCAFRRTELVKLGGFDPAYEYYLDEVDVNMRLAIKGKKTAVVPLAQVHHGYLDSLHRHLNRMPKSLFEVGASTAVFLRKFCEESLHRKELDALFRSKRRALIDHMVKGNCEPGDVKLLLSSLLSGFDAGHRRKISDKIEFHSAVVNFLPFSASNDSAEYENIAGYRLGSAKLHAAALASVKQGKITTLYEFSRTTLYHRVFFHEKGYWMQRGGLFGKSKRSESLAKLYTLDGRVAKEAKRVESVRAPGSLNKGHFGTHKIS